MAVEQGGIPEPESQEGVAPKTSDKLAPLLGFLALIILCVTLVSFIIPHRATIAFWIFLVLSIGLVAAFVALKFREIAKVFTSRQARYSANVTTSILGVIGIVVIINVIIVQRFDKAADWTPDKLFTLSDQTKKILKGLKREVKVIAFFSINSADDLAQRQYARAKDMLERYQRETRLLKVEFVDPFADALKREAYKVEFDGTVIFESGAKRERVTTVDEQKFTSAIMKVVRDELKKIYFLTGHDEHAIDDFERTGYSQTKEELVKQNYLVETLTLTTQPKVSADCAVLVIPGSKAQLTNHEIKEISKYLDRNGKLLMMFEPSLSVEDTNQGLVDLMDKWGVTVGNDLVFDRINPAFFLFGGTHPEAPTVSNFEFHQITRYVDRPVAFQITRSVTPKAEPRTGITVESLAKTVDEIGGSWGETTREANGAFAEPAYTEGEDTPPPVSLAVAVQVGNDDNTDTNKETKTRIVVVGDSDFASNAFFESTGGGVLFLNMVNWLTLEEDLISIRPINPSERSLRRITTASEAAFVQITSVFFVPLIVFIIGVFVWWRRR